MEKTTTIFADDLKKQFRSFKYSPNKMHRIKRILRWTLIIFGIILMILFIAYNCIFENYQVIGESIDCTTNVPFKVNYTCKLDIIDNNTQFWSFESILPDGLSLSHMMARVSTYHWSHGKYKAVFLKNTTIDFCKYSGGHISKLFVNLFLPDLLKTSNLNRPCPFTGAIYMRNFQFLRSLKLPRVVPGKWLIEFHFYEEELEELSFTVRVHLEIRPIGWHLFEFELN